MNLDHLRYLTLRGNKLESISDEAFQVSAHLLFDSQNSFCDSAKANFFSLQHMFNFNLMRKLPPFSAHTYHTYSDKRTIHVPIEFDGSMDSHDFYRSYTVVVCALVIVLFTRSAYTHAKRQCLKRLHCIFFLRYLKRIINKKMKLNSVVVEISRSN